MASWEFASGALRARSFEQNCPFALRNIGDKPCRSVTIQMPLNRQSMFL